MTHRILASSSPAALLFAAGLVSASSGAASAQTSFAETEPNSTKQEANAVNGIVAGDNITGTTTGTLIAVGLTLVQTADTFRVKTAALPLGIWEHTLTITTSGTAGHVGTILGVSQLNGVINPNSDVTFATSTATGRANIWYGFGKQEEVYYRVTGTTATTAPYVSTLTTAPVTPIAVAGSFNPGSVTVSSLGQGHTTDTEIYVYDGALNPIPLGHQDDPIGTVASPSTVTLVLAPGTYYVAIADWNLANNQSDLNPAEQADDDTLMDFPDVMANNTTGLNVNVQFSVTDGATTTVVPALRANPFEVVWATFTVTAPSTPNVPFCFGDGSGTACPCGNSGQTGNGCASSVNTNGANLASSGLASIANDSLVLTGTGMPNASALYFQGTTRVNAGLGTVFGDGLRCAGGSVIRLGTKTNAGGTSSYPTGSDVRISVKGANAAGNVRDYQCWYRNAAAFCTTSTFNLTNGLELTWAP